MASADVTKIDSGPHTVTYRVDVGAPAAEVFAIVADPRRHSELDGSGTVRDTVSGPDRLSKGARFSVRMKMNGVPYRMTSKVTDFADDRVVEWRHPLGHRWRWEFEALSPTSTRVTETFDFSHAGGVGGGVYGLLRFPKVNAAGIKKTLRALRERYPGS